MKNQEIINNSLAEEPTLLAAERTFSAWIRTALAAMAGGLAVMRLIGFKSEFHSILVASSWRNAYYVGMCNYYTCIH